MFDAIAGRYDLLNHLLSGGLDWWWRARAVRAARFSGGERLLDLCTGTGDLARAAARARPGPAAVVAADFAGAMLARAREKLRRRRLPVPDLARAGRCTPPPGRRRVGRRGDDRVRDPERGRRRRGGARDCTASSETGRPARHTRVRAYPSVDGCGRSTWSTSGACCRWSAASCRAIPTPTGTCPASVSAFETPDQLRAILGDAGFRSVVTRPLSGGIVRMYVAER